jgi:hypothetical protein
MMREVSAAQEITDRAKKSAAAGHFARSRWTIAGV